MSPRAIVLALAISSTAQATAGFAAHAATNPGDHLGVAINSREWASLELELLHPYSTVRAKDDLAVGLTFELPILSTVLRPGPDFVRAGARVLLRVDPDGPLFALADGQVRIGFHSGVLGQRLAPDVVAQVLAGGRWGTKSIGLQLGVQQVLFAMIWNGDAVKAAFDVPGSSSRAPDTVVLAFPSTRAWAGLQAGWDVSEHLALTCSAAWVWTPSAISAGAFGFMMLGLWPFEADVGIVHRF